LDGCDDGRGGVKIKGARKDMSYMHAEPDPWRQEWRKRVERKGIKELRKDQAWTGLDDERRRMCEGARGEWRNSSGAARSRLSDWQPHIIFKDNGSEVSWKRKV